MQIKKEDLLNINEMKALFSALSPTTKAEIICKKLQNYVFMDKNDRLNFIRTNITYRVEKYTDDRLYSIVSAYLNDSYQALEEKKIDKWQSKYEKKKEFTQFIKSNLSNNSVKTYLPQLKMTLKNDTIVLDDYSWQLHFNNGYIDLKTGEFKKRVYGKDYVSYCITRDYEPSTGEDRSEIMSHIIKIYPDHTDRKCVLSHLAKCLIGKPQNDQDTLFLMGHGSSGKSFVLSLTKNAIGEYVEILQSDTFDEKNKDRNKIFNQLYEKRYVLIVWINEFSDKRINDPDFKNFCDGIIKTTRLYQDGSFSILLRCKLVATTNLFPNMQINSGLVRRFLSYTHIAKFVKTKNEVNEKKHIYLANENLLNEIAEKENLLNAWIDILVEQCKLIHKNEAPELTENFKLTTNAVLSTNDNVQDFIDACLIITNDVKDRLGKNEMQKEFQTYYPNKHLSIQQLISSLKEKNIVYQPKFRCENVQGCFTGVRLRENSDPQRHDDIEEIPESKPKKVYRKIIEIEEFDDYCDSFGCLFPSKNKKEIDVLEEEIRKGFNTLKIL
jgi:phage/plasmid-associated DNA primase